jgi:hypothetical protein
MIQVSKIKSLILIQGKILFEDPLNEIRSAENDGMSFTVHGNGSDRPGLDEFSPCIFRVVVIHEPIAVPVDDEYIGIDLVPIDQGFQLALVHQFC